MDTPSTPPVFYSTLLVVVLLTWGASGLPLSEAMDSHTIHLQRVDAAGNAISQVPHYHHHNDSINSNINTSHYFRFTNFKGTTFFLELVKNQQWMTGDVSVEIVRDNGSSLQRAPRTQSSCHYAGLVRRAKDGGNVEDEEEVGIGEVMPDSWAALSGCDGQLTGVIELVGDYYFIEAAPPTQSVDSFSNAHTLTKATSKPPGQHCSTQSSRTRELAGKTSGRGSYLRRRRRKRLAVSLEYFMEVAVVTEPDMLKDRTIEDLEAYVFSIMNIVAHLYRDASLGHSMKVALLRVIVMDANQSNIVTGNSGKHPLAQFCKWIGNYDKSRGLHEDVAILLTKQSMCDSATDECNVLGMADIGTACMKGYSCNIVRDHGLSTAFSMAHEMGHTLSMEHDDKKGCSSGESFIMAASFTQSSNPHIWSQCSRNSLSQFLKRDGSSCLQNRPPAYAQLFNSTGTVSLPGFEYSVTEQCQMSLGHNASGCTVAKNPCRHLWCRSHNSSSCTNLASPPAPGTECRLSTGTGMGICYKGECVRYSSVMTPVEGGWSQWSTWTNCSLSCGTGLQSRTRSCTSPVPQFGGNYCVGKRKEFRMCNKEACPGGHTHRQQHCEIHPPMSGHSNWTAVSMDRVIHLNLDVCKSHCYSGQSDNPVIYTSLVSLPDGTACHTHQHSKGACLAGECEPLGCDGMLWSEWMKDECGVWCGDGSSCLRVAGTHSPDVTNGVYRYYMSLTIPAGSTYIRVSETTPSSSNYIAVMARGSSTFINGNFRVLYSGRTNFTLAKAAWLYERAQSNGAEIIATDGPVVNDVFVYVLAVQSYEGLSYSFSLPRDKMNLLTREVYFWKTTGWRSCDSQCGRGKQTRAATCSKLSPGGSVLVGVAEELCTMDKPKLERECDSEGCSYSWVTSEWSQCNATCDGTGIEMRTFSCQQKTHSGAKTLTVANHHCGETLPTSRMCRVACQYEWEVGPWRSCDAVCGRGWRERIVACVRNTATGNRTEVEPHHCNKTTPLSTRGSCQSPARSCSDFYWETSEWSQCLGQCWRGFKIRRRLCRHINGSSVDPQFCHKISPPGYTRSCIKVCPPATPTSLPLTAPTTALSVTTPTPELCEDQLMSHQCRWLRDMNYCHTYGQYCCYTCSSTR